MGYEVQQTRWDRLIRRVSGSIGPGSRVSETLTELFPVLDVEDLPPELLFLAGTKLGFGGTTVSGVAAESAKVQLFNPADSGNIITITSALVRTDATQTIRFTNESSPRTAVNTERHRDTRAGILPATVGEVRSSSEALLIPAIGVFVTLANVTFVLKDRNGLSVLAPGTGFVIGGQSLNVGLTVTYFWHERVAEASELQF